MSTDMSLLSPANINNIAVRPVTLAVASAGAATRKDDNDSETASKRGPLVAQESVGSDAVRLRNSMEKRASSWTLCNGQSCSEGDVRSAGSSPSGGSSGTANQRLSPKIGKRNKLNGSNHSSENSYHSLAHVYSAAELQVERVIGSGQTSTDVNDELLFHSASSPPNENHLSPRIRMKNKINRNNRSSSRLSDNSYSSPTTTLGEMQTETRSSPSGRNDNETLNNRSTLSQTTLYTSAPLSTYRGNGNGASPSGVLNGNTSSKGDNSGNGNNLGTTSTSQTSPPRTPSLAAVEPSTSSWNNSNGLESDYVVDPVQGNAYYKGQFLGKGGFARVYLMTDVANGNQYACKIIPKNRMQKIHMQKIAREIMIHKELNHVNVVQMHHYFEDNLHAYMLLEACPRKSLMHVLKYRGKVTEPEARYYMRQMVTGVAYIHAQKVVHRDLKPGNMFLSEHMIVKIGDFGLATRPDGQRRRVTICGTPNYIAPEVLYKQAYSYEADVWALGCILYALLIGQPPFETATLKETYARICNNQYKELDDTQATRSGQDLIRWLLQSAPELRPSLEKVKEHAYLTKEFVPSILPSTCCHQIPPHHVINPPPASKRVQVEGLTHSVSAMTIPKSSLKEGKINWLVRKFPRLPRFRQRLSSVLCPDHKKGGVIMQSTQMHRMLEMCINGMKCACTSQNPPTVDDITPLFVTKWIDYSNKYGLGFQLSDRSIGVLFNDSTKMSYTQDRRRVEYMTTDDEITRYDREIDVPEPLQKKLDLLQHFTEYMDDHLTEGGEVRDFQRTRPARACVPRMRRWLRTNKAIVMELTIPLLQVNFFRDHTKMVVSQETQGKGYLVTYIDAGRHASSYWLNDLRDQGCTADLYEKLYYVCKVSREFAEMDQNMIA